MPASITAFLNSALGGGATFYKSHIFWGNVIVLVASLTAHLPAAVGVVVLAIANAIAGALEA